MASEQWQWLLIFGPIGGLVTAAALARRSSRKENGR